MEELNKQVTIICPKCQAKYEMQTKIGPAYMNAFGAPPVEIKGVRAFDFFKCRCGEGINVEGQIQKTKCDRCERYFIKEMVRFSNMYQENICEDCWDYAAECL